MYCFEFPCVPIFPPFHSLALPAMSCEAEATRPMNLMFGYLYSCGFWIPSHKAVRVAKYMFHFLGSYQRLAYLSLRAGKNRYQLIPKLHYLSHIALKLQREASQSRWVQTHSVLRYNAKKISWADQPVFLDVLTCVGFTPMYFKEA